MVAKHSDEKYNNNNNNNKLLGSGNNSFNVKAGVCSNDFTSMC